MWDYSRYNIENYGRRVRKTQPRLQYLPFSFLSTKAQLPLCALLHACKGKSHDLKSLCSREIVTRPIMTQILLLERPVWQLCNMSGSSQSQFCTC